MKKIFISSTIILATSISMANYKIKYNLESLNIDFKSKIEENWFIIEPNFTDWTNTGPITGCNNWTPDYSTVNVGQTFTQTATDCKQNQTRDRQDREQESTTLVIRNKGELVQETQSITVSSTRQSTGTKENWIAANPTYTAWVNSGSITGCNNWSPATNTVNSGVTFTQTATDCKQNQTRDRQEREQESTTKVYRNKGSVVQETQTITVSSTRQATGTKSTVTCTYQKNKTFIIYGTESVTIAYNGTYMTANKLPYVKSGYTYTVGKYKENIPYYNKYEDNLNGGWYEVYEDVYYYEVCRQAN